MIVNRSLKCKIVCYTYKRQCLKICKLLQSPHTVVAAERHVVCHLTAKFFVSVFQRDELQTSHSLLSLRKLNSCQVFFNSMSQPKCKMLLLGALHAKKRISVWVLVQQHSMFFTAKDF
jgi:hypothetical protein